MVTNEIFLKNLLLQLAHTFMPFAENIKNYEEVIEKYEQDQFPKPSCFAITLEAPCEAMNLMAIYNDDEKIIYKQIDRIKDWLVSDCIVSSKLTQPEYVVHIYFSADSLYGFSTNLDTPPIKLPIIIRLLRNVFFDNTEMLLNDNQVINYWS